MRAGAKRVVSSLLAVACLLACGGGVAAQAASLAELMSLLELKAAVVGSSSALAKWDNTTDPCAATAPWAGVNCTAGRVTSVALPRFSLSGKLPSTLGLPELQVLDLSSNKLTGPLPPTLQLAALQRLMLDENQLIGSLPATWAVNFPQLQQLTVQGNRLASTLPPAWLQATGFSTPFTAVVQPGNPLLCGSVSPAANHTLLFSDAGLQHEVITTLGSCAQDANCGAATVNRSATNLYDLAWSNRAAPLDLEYFNPNVQQNDAPKLGTPVALPCYPSNAPTFFGSDAAYRKATWQSSTEGGRTSFLPVSGNRKPATAEECSMTLDAPGFWMVDLQVSTQVLAVLVRGGEQQMQGVDVRVSDTPNPSSGSLCKSGDSFDPNQGKIIVCDRILLGRYVSISAQTKISLCVVEVYPLVANAALAKSTTGSAGTGESTQAGQLVNGNSANIACSTVVSGPNLAAWITIDMGYEANMETVVVQNGYSTFTNDLYVRVGNTPVVNGDENPICSQAQTLAPRNTLPIECIATGRFLTLYRKLEQASDMYICQVFAFLSDGPTKFYVSPPSPPSPPGLPPPAPTPPLPTPIGPLIDVSATTTVMNVAMELQGYNLLPLTPEIQDNILWAAQNVWEGEAGMMAVTVQGLLPLASPSVSVASAISVPTAAAPSTAAAPGRLLLQVSGNATGVLGRLQAQLQVAVQQGQAPSAANFIAASATDGTLAASFADQGMSATQATVMSIQTLDVPAPAQPPPSPAPPSPSNVIASGGSSVPVGAIVGGVAGGIVVVALVAGFIFVRRRSRRRAGQKGGIDDDDAASPKVASMEQGRSHPMFGMNLPKPGDNTQYSVAVAAAGENGRHGWLDAEPMTQGPPLEIISFLADDLGSEHSAFMRESPSIAGGMVRSDSLPLPLVKQKSIASRMDAGVSELWTVEYKELDIQKQIGEGSFGKVYLAKWRQTTVAVKVLGNIGSGASPGLDDEFPDAASALGHPLYESLQKEAAMMASLRHPSIVMYLGVCLDPPAVVTEYCARGSLNDVLKRARSSPLLAQQLDWARRLNMALDAAKGMLYLHSCSPPIIHRDLKSANLLVDKHWRVRVCDFNLSRVMEDSAVLSSVAATNPRWLAPEILSGKGYTFASDVYSFGICMWEMLTWQVPYHEYGPWQVVAMVTENCKRPEVPVHEELPTGTFSGEDEYLELMHECWAQDPESRPNFSEVINRLRMMLGLEASLRRSESPTKALRGPSLHGDETPGARSRLTSLTPPSELCLTPDRRTTAGEDSDAELTLSGSPTVLGSNGGGGGGASSSRPPRHSINGGSPAMRQLSSIAGGGTDEAEAIAATAAAAANEAAASAPAMPFWLVAALSQKDSQRQPPG